MKVLFLSPSAALHGAAARCQNEGADVQIAMKLPALADVPVTHDWRPAAKLADLVVTDGDLREATPRTLRSISRFFLGGRIDLGEAPRKPITAIWNGEEWMQPWFKTAALQRMLSGDLGAELPYTALALRSGSGPLPFVPPVEFVDDLRLADYRGPVHFASPTGVAYAASAILAALGELLRAPLSQTLYDIASARRSRLSVWNETAVALLMSTPPYPFGRLKNDQRPSVNVALGAARHFWPADMSLRFEQAGWSGFLGYATARGRGGSLREVSRRLAHVLSGINGSELALQYRIDATTALAAQFEENHNG